MIHEYYSIYMYEYVYILRMDQFVRYFRLNSVETYCKNSIKEYNRILNNNKAPNNFKIMQMNIRSLNKNLDEFLIM